MTAALYVYAIAPAATSAEVLGEGIDRAETVLVSAGGGPVAVVHEHDGGPYEGADAEVQRWVLEHGAVVERVWEQSKAVLPVSFNVIVAGPDAGAGEAPLAGASAVDAADAEAASAERRLRDWLEQNAGTLAERLNALRDRVELRIEIMLDTSIVAEHHPETAVAEQEMAQRPAGVQRLLRKRLEQRARELTDALADELYPEYRRRLAAVSEELVENRSARPERDSIAVVTVSVLVPEDEVPAVGTVLAAIQEEQPAARIRFLGPWPPYSFAEVPDTPPQTLESST